MEIIEINRRNRRDLNLFVYHIDFSCIANRVIDLFP